MMSAMKHILSVRHLSFSLVDSFFLIYFKLFKIIFSDFSDKIVVYLLDGIANVSPIGIAPQSSCRSPQPELLEGWECLSPPHKISLLCHPIISLDARSRFLVNLSLSLLFRKWSILTVFAEGSVTQARIEQLISIFVYAFTLSNTTNKTNEIDLE